MRERANEDLHRWIVEEWRHHHNIWYDMIWVLQLKGTLKVSLNAIFRNKNLEERHKRFVFFFLKNHRIISTTGTIWTDKRSKCYRCSSIELMRQSWKILRRPFLRSRFTSSKRKITLQTEPRYYKTGSLSKSLWSRFINETTVLP